MRKLLGISILLIGCISCSNEIDIHADLDYQPVVYSILNLNSDQQYVRISRTYRSDNEHFGMSPLADSLIIHEPCEIYIEKWMDGDPVETYLFAKTVTVKDSGFFPVSGQELYLAQFTPEPLTHYILYVYFPDIGKVVSGETVTTTFPVAEDPQPELARYITITRDRGFTARWYSVEHGGVYQGIFTVIYMEILGESSVFQHIDWLLPNIVLDRPNELITQDLHQQRFFDLLIEGIPVVSDVRRELVGMEFCLIAGDEELGLALRTSDIKDFAFNNDYTNLDNGVGLFSSVARTYIQNLKFSYLTEDAVCSDPELSVLNFKKSGSHE